MDKNFVLLKLKHSGYSIYEEKRDKLAYEIKSKSYNNAEIVAYPSKQIVGKLQHNKKGKVREVAIEVFNNQTQQWQNGKIIHTSIGWVKQKIDIEWNGQSLEYIYGPHGEVGGFFIPPDTVLAEYQYQWRVKKRREDYEVEVYSNAIPDPAYFLFVAAIIEIMNPVGSG